MLRQDTLGESENFSSVSEHTRFHGEINQLFDPPKYQIIASWK
jgi:hypothetical protein